MCHLKLRDSKQECCGLVARVTTSHVTLLDPWWLQEHGVGRVQGHSAPLVCSSLYSLRAMSRSRNPVRQHELTSKDSKQKPEDEAEIRGRSQPYRSQARVWGVPEYLGAEEGFSVGPFCSPHPGDLW